MGMKKIILAFAFIVCGFTKIFAQSGDLEVVSIDPEVTTIEKGKELALILQLNQNGPDNLPPGSARVSISFNTAILRWKTPLVVTDDCGNVWTVQTSNVQPTTALVQLRNNNAVLPNLAQCFIRIPVVAYEVGTTPLTATSTVFGAGLSDPNGTNQGSTGTLVVTAPLPVKLVKFTAVKENKTTILDWATTEEVNSDRFDVERSSNGKAWSTIGSVKSNGESAALRNYSWPDAQPLMGENLYRLKMIDKDATFAYSRIVSVKFDHPGDSGVVVYPNPVSERIYLLDADLSSLRSAELINPEGKLVLRSSSISANGIVVDHMTPGLYTLRLTDNVGKISSRKVVIAR